MVNPLLLSVLFCSPCLPTNIDALAFYLTRLCSQYTVLIKEAISTVRVQYEGCHREQKTSRTFYKHRNTEHGKIKALVHIKRSARKAQFLCLWKHTDAAHLQLFINGKWVQKWLGTLGYVRSAVYCRHSLGTGSLLPISRHTWDSELLCWSILMKQNLRMESQSEVIPVMPTPLHLLLFCCVHLGSPGLGQVI